MARLVYFVLFSIILFSSQWVHAVPVETFTFQGLLKDNSGNLLNTQKDITLRLYTIPTGGSATSIPGSSCPKSGAPFCVWQENQTNIGIVNGIFIITAGNQTSLNRVDFTKALYLEVIMRNYVGTSSGSHIGVANTNFGNDQVLSPRINMTATPFALSAERGNFGYFNGTQFLINQTNTSDKKLVFNVTNMGIGTLVNLKSGATFNNILNITAGSLTRGSALNITAGSASTEPRNLVVINQNNTAANAARGLFINQAGNAEALAIKSQGNPIAGTAAVNITASGLTTGSALLVKSTSTSGSFRNLVEINQNSTAANAAVGLFINQAGNAPALAIKSNGAGKSNTGVLNITAGGLTAGPAVNVAGFNTNTGGNTRHLINFTSTGTGDAAKSTSLLSLYSRSPGGSAGIIRAQNASGAVVFNVTSGGITTVTQLKVNTTGITLQGIFMGRNTTVVTLGTNTITVTNTDGNDAATCTFQSGVVAPATPSKTFFVTVGNVTTNAVFVNVTYTGPGSYPRAPFPLTCIVFDIP